MKLGGVFVFVVAMILICISNLFFAFSNSFLAALAGLFFPIMLGIFFYGFGLVIDLLLVWKP